jgi:hypothetical protein
MGKAKTNMNKEGFYIGNCFNVEKKEAINWRQCPLSCPLALGCFRSLPRHLRTSLGDWACI